VQRVIRSTPFEELLADASVDFTVVAIPNNFHKDVSIALLESGKNVVCEKPVTLNIFDLFEIQKASAEAGKWFPPSESPLGSRLSDDPKDFTGQYHRRSLLYREPGPGVAPQSARLARAP
jgi:hypothetical protein